ncbi:hypothetical protein [Streptococcus suis]|uniref:Uncharacterized protein n=1 Tax=Streptococcus suis TaxID=1307 RepID=A0A123TM82_STRSU|nr:hypothetical protein [Streptococcus suis]NQG84552.1 hypothetical protein [Streptococcus suis]CYV44481.1 Uncharacterised protein [Streptococcus suis]
MTKHKKFILTPITLLLEEAVLATTGMSDGIHSFALSDYIFQSVLLKMAGFQEQKMKCISWDIATHDFEFRFAWLDHGHKSQGTYSTYESKNYVYKELIKAIQAVNEEFIINNSIERDSILREVIDKIECIFVNSSIVSWRQRHFDYFTKYKWTQSEEITPSNEDLFSKLGKPPKEPKNENGQKNYEKELAKYSLKKNINLVDKYKAFYSFRNQIAHNTKSYQQNLPILNILSKENDESRNYFIWFAVLTIIDEVFMKLYSIYVDIVEEQSEFNY